MPSYLWALLAVATAAVAAGSVVADDKPLKPGEVREYEIAAGVKMKFCWIPPGEAQLGSPKKECLEVLKQVGGDKELERRLALEAEEVRGRYETKGFWLGKYPTTQGEWHAVMGHNPSSFSKDGDDRDKVAGLDTSRFPVESVSWNDCGKFLAKLNGKGGGEKLFGKRGKFALPHEDEWEYACRGGLGNGRAYYFGDVLNGKQANCDGLHPYGAKTTGPYREHTTAVGFYENVAPHPWGLCDMHGNVLQWCENWHDGEQKHRVLRGGSWNDDSWLCRTSSRTWDEPNYHSATYGFRVCFRLD